MSYETHLTDITQNSSLEPYPVNTPLGRSALLFTGCRYVVYGLMFARGLLAAKFLGPYFLGIFGFLALILQYLVYCGLGLQFAVNVELAIHSGSDRRRTIAAATTLTTLIAVGIATLGIAIQVLKIPIFGKYEFCHYALLVGVVGGTSMLQQVYTNVYRVYGRLSEIAITELFCALVLLALTSIFRARTLVSALLVGWALSGVFAVALFALRAPFGFLLSLERTRLRALLALGLPLLVYNASFFLTTMVAQSVISIYYTVEAMGYYTLATSIANAVLLGFNSISWIVYPSILARTCADVPDAEAVRIVDRINVLFGTGAFLAVFAGVLLLPVLFWILPGYIPAQGTLIALLLAQALRSCSFGFNCLAIARKKQMAVARISMLSVLFVSSCAVFAGVNQMHFVWVAAAVLTGSLLFSVLQARLGRTLIQNSGEELRSILPLGTIFSVLVCLGGVLLEHPMIGTVGGSLLFLVANKERILELWKSCEPHVGTAFGRMKVHLISQEEGQ